MTDSSTLLFHVVHTIKAYAGTNRPPEHQAGFRPPDADAVAS